jgi:hypothetical protein
MQRLHTVEKNFTSNWRRLLAAALALWMIELAGWLAAWLWVLTPLLTSCQACRRMRRLQCCSYGCVCSMCSIMIPQLQRWCSPNADASPHYSCRPAVRSNQCLKWRTPVVTRATPYLLQQSTASWSRMLPPGCAMAATPACRGAGGFQLSVLLTCVDLVAAAASESESTGLFTVLADNSTHLTRHLHAVAPAEREERIRCQHCPLEIVSSLFHGNLCALDSADRRARRQANFSCGSKGRERRTRVHM